MRPPRPDRDAPGTRRSDWTVRGGLHLLAAGSVMFVVAVAGTMAAADRMRVLDGQRATAAILARAASILVDQVMARADGAANALLSDPRHPDPRAFALRIAGTGGILREAVLRPDGTVIAEYAAAAPAGADTGLALAEYAPRSAAGYRLRVTLDADWLRARLSALAADGPATISVSDGDRPLIRAGGSALPRRPEKTDRGFSASCICVSAAPGSWPLLVTAGVSRAAALDAWHRTSWRLAVATSLALAMLMAFHVGLERRERRESRRLRHVADAMARLANASTRRALFERLAADTVALLNRGTGVAAVLPVGTGQPGRRFPLIGRDGRIEDVLVVTTRRGRALSPRAAAGIEQLAFTAAHMLEGIAFAEHREAELSRARRLRDTAERSLRQIEALFAAMPDAVLTVDEHWRPAFRNRAARDLMPGPDAGTVWDRLPAAVRVRIE
ncbi:MAG: hypothetical protein INR65_07260, partial [Gluconacetobacter diazotrophicus]|nr:hypothetical protein [Gluconacetobacter diazotrophicus]